MENYNATQTENNLQETSGYPQPVAPQIENAIRNIEITQLNRGYVVRVGCHSFAFESPDTMIANLSAYIKEPAATEEKWFNKTLF